MNPPGDQPPSPGHAPALSHPGAGIRPGPEHGRTQRAADDTAAPAGPPRPVEPRPGPWQVTVNAAAPSGATVRDGCGRRESPGPAAVRGAAG